MGHNGQNAVLEGIQRCKIEQEAEDALPDVLFGCLERLSDNFVYLLVQIELHAVVWHEFAYLLVYLPLLMLAEVHQGVPVRTEAIGSQGPLHLLRIQEVEIRAEEFTLQGFDIARGAATCQIGPSIIIFW